MLFIQCDDQTNLSFPVERYQFCQLCPMKRTTTNRIKLKQKKQFKEIVIRANIEQRSIYIFLLSKVN